MTLFEVLQQLLSRLILTPGLLQKLVFVLFVLVFDLEVMVGLMFLVKLLGHLPLTLWMTSCHVKYLVGWLMVVLFQMMLMMKKILIELSFERKKTRKILMTWTT